MRIVFVLSGLGAGGAEKVVNLLAHHRSECGDTVHVLAVNAESATSYFPYDPAIAVETLGHFPRAARGIAPGLRMIALRRRLRVLRPDLVVSFLTKINVMVALASLTLGIPTVISERNNLTLQKMNPIWRWIHPLAARGAACIVLQTDLARRSLPRRSREQAVVIPNPVTPAEGPARVVDRRAVRVVAAGRLEPQKGFDLLLEAFAGIAKDLPNVTLTIFGDGPRRGDLERQARELGIADRVTMPGVTASPGIWTAAGDIFVLSSRFEGFPNVLLEALMAGMATIAFDCPWGPAEILADPNTGLLVPAGDVAALGDAIRRVATDAVLRENLAAAGPRIADRYSKTSVLGQWDNAIAGVIRTRIMGIPIGV